MMRRTEHLPDWSRGGIAAALIVLGQGAAGWIAALQGMRVAPVTLGLAAAGGIASIVVLARCRMPASAKAALITASCASLLTVIATQDLQGLRQVERTTADALIDSGIAAGQPARTRTIAPVAVVATDPDDALAAKALARDLDGRLQTSGADLTVAATLAESAGGLRVSWTLVRGGDRLWCGLETAHAAPGDAAFAMLGDRVAAAARRSHGGTLDCA